MSGTIVLELTAEEAVAVLPALICVLMHPGAEEEGVSLAERHFLRRATRKLQRALGVSDEDLGRYCARALQSPSQRVLAALRGE